MTFSLNEKAAIVLAKTVAKRQTFATTDVKTAMAHLLH
jgi:hypothetical protein